MAQSEQIWPPNLMFFIVVRTSRPHPPVSISTHGLQLLLTISEMGCISPVNSPVRSQGSRRAKMGGGYGADNGGWGAPRLGLKPQSITLGWSRSRATEQKPGSRVTPPQGRPPGHLQPRNPAAARARGWACTGLPTTTGKISYSSPAPPRSRLQSAT